ncbi:MAG: sporulation integral membrane protein YtvI [Vulcanibacillus sp.]
MISFYKKYGRTVFDILLIILTVYIFMYLFSSFFNIAKPVAIALVIYLIIEPFAKFLNRKIKIKKVAATTISTLLFVVIVFGLVITLGVILFNQIFVLSEKVPEYIYYLQNEIVFLLDKYDDNINAISPDVFQSIKEYLMSISSKIATFLQTVFLSIIASLSSVSTLAINILLGIILAFFLSLEIDNWEKLAKEKTPKTFRYAFIFLKENVIKGITLYLKAQLKLISITFVLVFIGLLITGVNGAFTLALIAGVLDILPLLGVSSLFLPWIIYLLIVNEFTTAIYLTVILVVVLIVRQVLEPRITGQSLGVSAFTMLSFMIISLSLFGIAGLIISPVLIILLKALNDQGYLKRWIHLPDEEYDQTSEEEKK